MFITISEEPSVSMRPIFPSNGDKDYSESSTFLLAYTASYPSKRVLPFKLRYPFLARDVFDFLTNITIQAEEVTINEKITPNLRDLSLLM
jgi:hypothetical protein